MFWLGIVFAVIAIVVTLMKELDEGRRSEEIILHLSITELVLAIVSIVISLSKHVIRHNSLVILQKNITVNRRRDVKTKNISGRQKVCYILAAILTVFLSVIIISFAVMRSKDDETYEYLTYTKFTTTITLFLSIIIDGIISDVISDTFSAAKIDQCKLAIHQMKIEMITFLNDEKEERGKLLLDFLENHDVFSLTNCPYIEFHKSIALKMTSSDTVLPYMEEKKNDTQHMTFSEML